ncbi:MAG: efflux RND transporter permease subunit, partial [Planctomycetota bacterium]
GISNVWASGAREPRIWVEVDPDALERYGLSLGQVGDVVAARAIDVPLGGLSTRAGEFLVRLESGVVTAEDLRSTPVATLPDGTRVPLSEVAHVREAYERTITRARFNGHASMFLQVNKEPRGDAIDVSRRVHELLDEVRPALPPGAALGTNSDLSIYVQNRLSTMRDSATLGGILVLVSLLLFLGVRVAFLTALGVPVAFLGGILCAFAFGISMNMITMFALIIVLGMVVDDAIVVAENVFRLMEEGVPPRRAAIEGTVQVGKPVVATILTTIAAFLPVLMVGGTMGAFMQPLPLVVTFCLLASLFEALVVLPSHLSHVRASARREHTRAAWYEPLRRAYVRCLTQALHWRYVTLSVAGAATVLLIGIAVYRIPFQLFDDFESKVFSISARATPGTSVETTFELIAAIEEVVFELPASELESTNSVAGVSYQDATQFVVGQNLGQVWVELREGATRTRPTAEIIRELRERLDPPPSGIERIDVQQPQAGPTGRAIDIAVRGPDLEVLASVSSEVQAALSRFRGVREVADNAQPGKRAIRVELSALGRQMGVTEGWLASELRSALEGVPVARVRRGRDDVEIHVKLPEALRERRGALGRLPIAMPDRTRPPLPLEMLADIEETAGRAVISRDDGERSLRITADVDKAEGNTARITEAIQEEFRDIGKRFPGTSIEFRGEHEDQAASLAGAEVALALALALIYVILGTLFRSFTQPFVIMGAIPFAAGGMIVGHLLLGRVLSFMSLIGFVALAGIVVNDSLILVDFVNQRRRAGESLLPALISAGRDRFRAIVLTSLTTMVGLSPLTFFASGQARFLQPMAISIFFGLLFSTLLILVVVPCGYAVLADLLRPFGFDRVPPDADDLDDRATLPLSPAFPHQA